MVKRIVLIVAAVLIVAGIALFVVTMAVNGWDFSLLDYAKRETVTHAVREEFSKIRIDTDCTNICLAPSEDGTCYVFCEETEKETYAVAVSGDTLTIQKNDKRSWYEHFNFGKSYALMLFLPKTEYDALEIKARTGDIEIPQGFAFAEISIATTTGFVECDARSESMAIAASAGNITVADTSAGSISISVSAGKVRVSGVTCDGDLSVSVSTGRTELEGVRCRNLTSTGSTGRLVMTDVIALGKLFAKRSTGDVKFDGCDAGEICVKTGTGDVTGTLLTDKVFFTETDTGDVNVPKTTTGGRCEITTDTGDIEIEIAK